MTNSLGNYGLNVNGYSGAFQNYYDTRRTTARPDTMCTITFPEQGSMHCPSVAAKITFPEPIALWMKRSAAGSSPWLVLSTRDSLKPLPDQGNNSNSYGNSRVNQYRKLKIVNRTMNQLVWNRSLGYRHLHRTSVAVRR